MIIQCSWPLLHRDLVHRQTAMAAIQHMALGVAGFGCEDALVHLLNYVWPNVFESSPHVVQAFMGAIEGLRVAIGPSKILQYTLQVRLAVFFAFTLMFLLKQCALWVSSCASVRSTDLKDSIFPETGFDVSHSNEDKKFVGPIRFFSHT